MAFIFFAGLSAWGGVFFNTMWILITDTFPVWIWTAYFMIQGGLLFVFHFLWVIGATNLTNLKSSSRKTFLIIVGIILGISQISWWIIVFTDISLFGTPSFPFSVDYSWISYIYLTYSLLIFTLGVGWIAYESGKTTDARIRLKSKFLWIYVIGITFGSFLEIYSPIEIILETYYAVEHLTAVVIASGIAKAILTFSVLCGYIGFMLPTFVEKMFLKE